MRIETDGDAQHEQGEEEVDGYTLLSYEGGEDHTPQEQQEPEPKNEEKAPSATTATASLEEEEITKPVLPSEPASFQTLEELQKLALAHCLQVAQTIALGKVPSKDFLEHKLCANLSSLYKMGGGHCPERGFLAIAAANAPNAQDVLAQTCIRIFALCPPKQFMLSLFCALRDAQRFDALCFLANKLAPMLTKESELLREFLRYGVCNDVVRTAAEQDLYQRNSWGSRAKERPFPWFESTYELCDHAGLQHRVQIKAQARVLARPVTMQVEGEEFYGMAVEAGERFTLQSALAPTSRTLALVWDKESGEVCGNFRLDGVAMRGFWAKEMRTLQKYEYAREDPLLVQEAQSIVLPRGASLQTLVDWNSVQTVAVWVLVRFRASEQDAGTRLLLSSRLGEIALDSSTGALLVNATNTGFKLDTGKWTRLSLRVEQNVFTLFQDDQLVFTAPTENLAGGEDFLTLGDARETEMDASSVQVSFCDLVVGDALGAQLARFPLVSYSNGSMEFVRNELDSSLPLLYHPSSSEASLQRIPSPIKLARKQVPGQIAQPFGDLSRGFAARIAFTSTTCTLVLRSADLVQFKCSFARLGNAFTCTLERCGVELVTMYNVQLEGEASHTFACRYDGQQLVLDEICKLPLALSSSPYYFAAVEGELAHFSLIALFSPLPLPQPIPQHESRLMQQQQMPKTCLTCTYSNEYNAQVCSMCEGTAFDTRATAAASQGEWKEKWNAFRARYLEPSGDSEQGFTLVLDVQTSSSNSSSGKLPIQVHFAPQVVAFECLAYFTETETAKAKPCLVYLDKTQQWHVNVRDTCEFLVDAAAKRVIWHTYANGTNDQHTQVVTLSQLMRTSQVGLVNMAPGLMNVCFQNAVLQSVFACSAVRELIMQEEGEATACGSLARELNRLFQLMAYTPLSTLTTNALQRVLPEQFCAGHQMDAQEFAAHLLDQVATARDTDALLGVKTWQERTCLRCHQTRADALPSISHSGLVLNLPRLFTPIIQLRLVSCKTQSETLPALRANETRLLQNLCTPSGGFGYLYVQRAASAEAEAGEVRPITNIYSRPQPGCEEISGAGGIKLYLSREEGLPPLTDLFLCEGDDVAGAIPCGKRYKLAMQSTMPITHVLACAANKLPPGYSKLQPALGENERGEAVFLAYSCARDRAPITRLHAMLLDEAEEEDAAAAVLIDGQRWTFPQDNAEGCPIIRLEVAITNDTAATQQQGERYELHRTLPCWRVTSGFSTFVPKTFTQRTIGDGDVAREHRVQAVRGSLGEFAFEDAILHSDASGSNGKVRLVAKLRADGSVDATWSAESLGWEMDGMLFTKQAPARLYELVMHPSAMAPLALPLRHVKLYQFENKTLYARIEPQFAGEAPIHALLLQTRIAGEAESPEPPAGYVPVCSFPLQGPEVMVWLYTSTDALPSDNALPLREVIISSNKASLPSDAEDAGEISRGLHVYYTRERATTAQEEEEPWRGSFMHQASHKLLMVQLAASKSSSTWHAAKEVEFDFGSKGVLRSLRMANGLFAWGFLLDPTRPLRRTFVKASWPDSKSLRLDAYAFQLQCALQEDRVSIVVHRDAREYWKDGQRVFSSRAPDCAVRTMLCNELVDSHALMEENMVSCESGENACSIKGAPQPHIARKRVDLPSTLVLHLNRMRFENGRTVKDCAITPLLEEEMDLGDRGVYSLVAVVSHIGTFAASGHYRAYCRYSTRRGEGFVLCDDAKPTTGARLSFSQLVQVLELQQRAEETPYLLFYEKQTAEETAAAPSSPAVRQALLQEFIQRYSASPVELEARRFALVEES